MITTADMKRSIASAINPFQSDTIEGFIKAVYFNGKMNVTVILTWCPDRDTQVLQITPPTHPGRTPSLTQWLPNMHG